MLGAHKASHGFIRSHRGPHGPVHGRLKRGNPKGGTLLRYSLIFLYVFCFLVSKQCFLSFSTQNHAESSRNFVKNSFLNPKPTKFDQNSDFGLCRACQGQSRRTSPCQQNRFLLCFFQKLHPSIFYQQI